MRQSLCSSSPRKKVFEEKASDQNPEREPGGRGQQEAGKEEGVLGSEGSFDLSTQDLPLVASLFLGWGEESLLRGCKTRLLRKGR